MRGLALAALSLLLIACAMGPNYSRPDIATSDSFRMAEEQKICHPSRICRGGNSTRTKSSKI